MAVAKKEAEKVDVGKIEFFGEPDRNTRGQISSAIPAWMMEQHIEELQENVDRMARSLEYGQVPAESIPYMKSELERERARLDKIKSSKPELKGPAKDAVAKARANLAGQIRNTAPTLRDDRNGYVRPHDEYKRLKSRHITIDEGVAKSLGIEPHGGKITGDQANRAYSILSAALNEDGSTEKLRRDWGQSTYRTEDSLTQEILGNGR